LTEEKKVRVFPNEVETYTIIKMSISYEERASDRTFKSKINRVLVQHTLQFVDDPCLLQALVLDGQEANTSHQLKHAGVPEANIYIPNMCVDLCQTLARSMPKAHIYNCTLNKAFKKLPTKVKLDLAFAD
jgi:hypothetical protein